MTLDERFKMPALISEEVRIQQINALPNIEFVSWVDCYKGSYSKANVRCLMDNYEWVATVNSLANSGSGCPQCSRVRRWTAEERIEQINSNSGIIFLSWDGEYKNHKSRANLKCDIDGFEWSARIDSVISSQKGCPKCSESGFNKNRNGSIYALRSMCGTMVKIGISHNTKKRHASLRNATPFEFEVIAIFESDGYTVSDLELKFHANHKKVEFSERFDGYTEWLVCTPDLLEEIRSIANGNSR